MFYFSCPCGRQGPRDSDEDLVVLYLIINPLDPSDTIDVALPWPFCPLVVRVVVIAETKAAKPILRCARRSVAREMTTQERVLALPQFGGFIFAAPVGTISTAQSTLWFANFLFAASGTSFHRSMPSL